jgi:hypothetical protein
MMSRTEATGRIGLTGAGEGSFAASGCVQAPAKGSKTAKAKANFPIIEIVPLFVVGAWPTQRELIENIPVKKLQTMAGPARENPPKRLHALEI